MSLRYGFKSEANWYAREMRRELKLAAHDPLCPRKLAEHLGFPVVEMSEYAKHCPDAVAYLRSTKGQKDFSAVTLFIGAARLIIYNDRHASTRQAADIAHELAHGLLLHPPKPPINSDGSRHYDAALEEEANWLGPALLVSDEAAMHIARQRMTLLAASNVYGVSTTLIQMRMNVSGAHRRLSRRAA